MNAVSTPTRVSASSESVSRESAWVPSCPAGCKRADSPSTHEFDHDKADGQTYVVHEVYFGEYAYGSVYEFVLVARREAKVTIDVETLNHGETTDPAVLSEFAASAIAAAEWLAAKP